ncbi:MAG: chorismate mutase [Alphaproteobacteria bacterium]
MPSSDNALARLRREIDAVDDAIQDLIVKRTALVEKVGKNKARAGGTVLRPGREAAVLRRLVARHAGAFPAPALIRIWREMMAASAGLQAPLSLAVYVPEGSAGLIEVARAQYGSLGRLTAYRSAGEVVGAVAEAKSSIGIVPAPRLDDADPWWRNLVGSEASVPPVIARLPFIGSGGDEGPEDGAMALAFAQIEETGDDRTLIVIEADGEVSRAAINSALEAAELETYYMDVRKDRGDIRFVLLELKGYFGQQDPRIDRLAARGVPINRVHRIGAFPAPFAAATVGLAP